MLKLFSRPEAVDLTKASINNRVNAPLIIRLKKYKDDKKYSEEFINWRYKHENKLTVSWRSYVENLELISFSEYCERFYNGTLPEVDPKSYFKIFKN